MSAKTLVWIGMTIGSIVGGFLPGLWDAGYFSLSGIICSGIGGIFGIWLGLKARDFV